MVSFCPGSRRETKVRTKENPTMQGYCTPSAPNLNPVLPDFNFDVRNPGAWYEYLTDSLVLTELLRRSQSRQWIDRDAAGSRQPLIVGTVCYLLLRIAMLAMWKQ